MRRWLACVLVMCMVLMLVSCSRAEEKAGPMPQEASPGEEPVSEEEGTVEDPEVVEPVEQLVQLASFYQIEEIGDIFANFAELEYSFSDADTEVVVGYALLGQGTVGNALADHVKITLEEDGSATEIEMWVDSEANVLSVFIDGEDTGPMGPLMASLFLMVVIMPFAVYAADWEGAFLQADGFNQYGWSSSSRDQTTRDFGFGTTMVHQYHVKQMVESQELEYLFEVAEISGMSLFVGWEVELGGGNKTAFRVTTVLPR